MVENSPLPTLVPEGAAFLRDVLDSLPAEVCVVDQSGQIIAVNEPWKTFGMQNGDPTPYGVGSNYLTGMSTADECEDAEMARDVLNGMKRILAGESKSYRLEYPCHSATEQRWFLMTARPLSPLPGSNKPAGAVITHLDITSRVTSERRTTGLMTQLQEQERRLDDLLRDVPASVWEAVTDPSATSVKWIYGSAHTRTMLGLSGDDWLDRSDFFFASVHHKDRKRVRQELVDLIEGDRAGVLHFRWVTGNGRVIEVESMTNVSLEDDGVVRLRCVTIDITRRLSLQKTLRDRAKLLIRTAKDLRQSNAELDQFAYVASHDLRAPLRGIRQLADFIVEDLADAADPGVRSKLSLMQDRVERMEKLIDGLLQYGRIGRTPTIDEDVVVRHVIDEVQDLLAPPAALQIHQDIEADIIRADRLRVQQVLLNLVSNAINHHDRLPQGPANIWIGCRNQGNAWAISVRDDGPGIDPKYHAKVYEIFQTLNEEGGNTSTGIGLSIVARIAERVDSRVELESNGRGTTFTFYWPKQFRTHRERTLPNDENY